MIFPIEYDGGSKIQNQVVFVMNCAIDDADPTGEEIKGYKDAWTQSRLWWKRFSSNVMFLQIARPSLQLPLAE